MEVKDFIEKFIEYIDEDNYDVSYGLYAHAWVNNVEPGEITEELLKADIDPLNYLNYIPWRYLSYSPRESFTIPEGITEIGTSAFFHSEITKLTVPSTIDKFGDDCFAASKIKEIFYNGTRDEFYDILNYSNEGRDIIVHAKDKDFKYEI